MPSAFRDQKKASNPMELELQMAVNDHVGAGSHTRALCKSTTCTNPLSHPSLTCYDSFNIPFQSQMFTKIFLAALFPNVEVVPQILIACLLYCTVHVTHSKTSSASFLCLLTNHKF